MKVREIATLLGASFEGDADLEILSVAALEDATPQELAFVTRGKAARSAEASSAGCLLVPEDSPKSSRTVIRVRDPRAAVVRVIAVLHPQPRLEPGIHPTAVIAQDARIDPAAEVGAFVTVGAGSQIAAGCRIGAHCAIGSRVRVAEGTVLHPRVTLYDQVIIGRECVLHAGSVIGADGFGFVLTGGAYQKFPQIGRVEIGDRVEIGANSCVDRAALGVTSIGEGTKLDNMVHIAHNCRLGRHVVIAAQTGMSGGVVVEDYAVIGGQVGIGDKVRIESKAVIGSGSGILTSKVVRGGQVVWGTPARPLKEYLEQLATLSRLSKKRRTASAPTPEIPST